MRAPLQTLSLLPAAVLLSVAPAAPAAAQSPLSFGDAALDGAIDRALAANYDVQAARARLAQADALSWTARASLMPQLSFGLGVNVQPYDALTFGRPDFEIEWPDIPGFEPPEEDEDEDPALFWSGSAMLNLGWQPDVFARQAHAHKASRLDVRAAAGDRDALAQATAVRVAAAWFDLAAAKARVAVIDEQIATNEQVLAVAELRFASSDGGGLDVAQQRGQLAATRALLPPARAAVRQLREQLRVLLALEPGEELMEPRAEIPEPAHTIDPVLDEAAVQATVQADPDELTADRPDLRAAVARAEAARARHVSAGLGLLPTLQLSGNAGVQGVHADEFDTLWTWGAGATLSVPIFSGLGPWGSVRQARAAEVAAAATLRQATATAQAQVASAVAREDEAIAQLVATEAQLEAAEIAFTISLDRYTSGLTGYSGVLLALASKQAAELSAITVRRERLAARVALLDALGRVELPEVR